MVRITLVLLALFPLLPLRMVLSQLVPRVESMLGLIFPLVPVMASTLQLSHMIMCQSLLGPMLMYRTLQRLW